MKRILAMALSVLLIAGMAIGGSVAYLTSTDDATNTFTMGEVTIEQHETDEAGASFDNNQNLLPSSSFKKASYTNSGIDTNTTYWTANNGEIDKVVTVENKGKTDAFVRTIFAFEDTGSIDTNGMIIKNVNGESVGTFEPVMNGTAHANFAYNGEVYNLYVFTYNGKLSATDVEKKITAPSLRQVAMAAEADSAVVKMIEESTDGKYTILVASQAVQAENMGTEVAKDALKEAFGEISSTNNPWVNDEAGNTEAGNVVRISTAAQLKALGGTTINGNTTIVFENDINLGGEQLNTIVINGIVKVVGNNHTISNGKMNSNVSYGFSTAAMFDIVRSDSNGATALTVENLSFDRITVTGNKIDDPSKDPFEPIGCAVVVGYADKNSKITLNNVDVSNSTITNNDGDAAALVGYSESSVAFKDCDVLNCTINGENKTSSDRDNDATYNDANIKYEGANNAHKKSAAFISTLNGWGQSENLTMTIENCTNASNAPAWYRYFKTNMSGTASKTYTIKTADEMVAFMEQVNGMNGKTAKSFAGETVVLMNDIDMTGKSWTPIGYTGANGLTGLNGKANDFKGTFDGNNHTIRNLTINNTSEGAACATGLFGFNYGMTVKNLTIDGANVSGHHWVGVIVGNGSQGITIQNCHVKNAVITNTHANGDACGDKAGGIAGYINHDRNSKVEGCTVENISITACRDAGLIVGCTKSSVLINCSASGNNSVTVDTDECGNPNHGANINSNANIGRENT